LQLLQRADLFLDSSENLLLILDDGAQAFLIFQNRRLIFLDLRLIGYDRLLVLQYELLICKNLGLRHFVTSLRRDSKPRAIKQQSKANPNVQAFSSWLLACVNSVFR
jgi:hypothetical protein